MFTLTIRLPHRGGDHKRSHVALERKHEPRVRAFLDSLGVHPAAAITYQKLSGHTRATCTVLPYPERSAP